MEEKRKLDPKFIALGVAIGAGAGVAFQNLPIGMGLGVVIGVLLARRKSRA